MNALQRAVPTPQIEVVEQRAARWKVFCRATIKVREPDNQDESFSGLVLKGGRSPTGGASPENSA